MKDFFINGLFYIENEKYIMKFLCNLDYDFELNIYEDIEKNKKITVHTELKSEIKLKSLNVEINYPIELLGYKRFYYNVVASETNSIIYTGSFPLISPKYNNNLGIVFLSLTIGNDLKHANILIYDFNRLTIERFEPYGDDGIDDVLDNYLDEELTWNTGFKYLRPKDFMTKPGYQLISDEGYSSLKPGDFGGFCLGWCIWYLEHRLRNLKVDPKLLNQKTIEK